MNVEILLKLFWLFIQVGVFSFGSGYAAFQFVNSGATELGLCQDGALVDIFAISGGAPGPVALSTSVGVGFRIAGLPGAFVSMLGIMIPCLILVIIIAKFLYAQYYTPRMQMVLKTLAPVTVSLIITAAIRIMMSKGILFSSQVIPSGWNVMGAEGNVLFEGKSILLAATSFLLFARTKVSIALLVIGGAVAGILIF